MRGRSTDLVCLRSHLNCRSQTKVCATSMKCFNHDASDAVAICKNCNKALCHTCAVDVGNGVACVGDCEQEVRAINELVRRNQTASQKTGYAYQRNAIDSVTDVDRTGMAKGLVAVLTN